MRGAEAVLGTLLVASGLLGPILGPAGPDIGEATVSGYALMEEIQYSGNASVSAAEASLRAQGPLNASVTAPSLSVTVIEYRQVGGGAAAFGMKVETGFQTKIRVEEHLYEDASVRVAGNATGMLLAWPNRTLDPVAFGLSLDPVGSTEVRASPRTEVMRSDEAFYSYQIDAPLFGLGHQDDAWRDVVLTNVSFDRIHAQGGLDIIVEDAVLTVEHAQGTDRHVLFEEPGDAADFPPKPGKHEVYAILTLDPGTLDMGFNGLEATLLARAPTWTVNGSLTFEAEDGYLRGPGEGEPLTGASVEINGNTTLALRAEGMDDGTSFPMTASLLGPVAPDPEKHGQFESEADHVALNGQTLTIPSAPPVPDEVTLLGKLLGALLIAWALLKKIVPFVVALLSRSPLDHPRRRRIWEVLEEMRVVHVRGLHRATGIPLGSLAYHLRVMDESGVVGSVAVANYRAYYIPTSDLARDEIERLALLADETRRDIVQALVVEDATTQQALAEHLGLTQSAVSRQLSKLVGAELVDRRGGRDIEYVPTELLTRWCRVG